MITTNFLSASSTDFIGFISVDFISGAFTQSAVAIEFPCPHCPGIQL